MNVDERRRRVAGLPPRTRALVEMLIRRVDLSVVDVAGLLEMGVANARKRLRSVYAAWELEGRTHLSVEYREAIGPEATPECEAGSSD